MAADSRGRGKQQVLHLCGTATVQRKVKNEQDGEHAMGFKKLLSSVFWTIYSVTWICKEGFNQVLGTDQANTQQ